MRRPTERCSAIGDLPAGTAFVDSIHSFLCVKSLLSVLAVILALVPLCRAGEYQVVSVTVPGADKVAVHLPASWKQMVSQPRQDLPPTVITTSTTGALSLQLTFIPDPGGRFATKDSVDRVVTAANQQYVSGSVEKRLSLTQLESPSGHGCYSTFTDADLVGVETPPAGQFRHVLSGVIVTGKQAVAFTLLTNRPDDPEYQQARQVITTGLSVQ